MPDQIIEGHTQTRDVELTPEFCIVGSGAAGGVCALKLAEAGFQVVVLEEGPHVPKGEGHGGSCHVRPTLMEREWEMYPRLYQEGGGRLTEDGGMLVMQGRCLGGGTAVNWSACLPPPLTTLNHWKTRFGLPLDSQSIRPYIQEVVNYLHIHQNDKYNSSAQVLTRGCEALGYHYGNLPNNTGNAESAAAAEPAVRTIAR